MRRQYLTLVLGVAGVIALSLMLVQVRGGFAYLSLFSLFDKLFHIQFGLLGVLCWQRFSICCRRAGCLGWRDRWSCNLMRLHS